MKHKWLGGLAIVALSVMLAAPTWGAETSYTVNNDYGVVTYKFVIDTDSNEAIGHYHKSGEAVKTAWVNVPVFTDFLIFTEYRDSDSSAKTFTLDTIHIALETAPYGGLAVDSVASAFKRQKASIMWNFASKVGAGAFTSMTSQHFFPAGSYGDTIFTTADAAAAAKDTIDVESTSLKTFAFGDLQGSSVPLMNLGKLRFSICLDAADSLLDGLIRMNCYIIFKDPAWPLSSTRFVGNSGIRIPSNVSPASYASLSPPPWSGHSRRYDKVHRIHLAPSARGD